MHYKFILMFIIPLRIFFSSQNSSNSPRIYQSNDTITKHAMVLAEKIKKGKLLYEKNCLMCHGVSGKGDGSAGIYLNPRPFDLSSKKVQVQNDSTLFYKITIGKAPMPPFKQLSYESRQLLVLYIREIAKTKTK